MDASRRIGFLAPVDLVIHCGDLTKILIAGNHGFSLDDGVFSNSTSQGNRCPHQDLENCRKDDFVDDGVFRNKIAEASQSSTFLDEEKHEMSLDNGEVKNAHARPYIPTTKERMDSGFLQNGAHEYAMPRGIHILLQHGRKHGIGALTPVRQRMGCPHEFSAIPRAQDRPCGDGHAHRSWGGIMDSWRRQKSTNRSHFNGRNGILWIAPRIHCFDVHSSWGARSFLGDEEQPDIRKSMFSDATLMQSRGLSQSATLAGDELGSHPEDSKARQDRLEHDSIVVSPVTARAEEQLVGETVHQCGDLWEAKPDWTHQSNP
ncbi:hypothetical protein CEK25_008860 [Fusarium fujikuroi]|nr:hypothetical protein CEK25_008860 [Fusarium fujikuroi]